MKIMAYKHDCGKPAFYSIGAPKEGASSFSRPLVSPEGLQIQITEAQYLCPHCDQPVTELKLSALRPARDTEIADLLVATINARVIALKERDVAFNQVEMFHEACSKVHPRDLPNIYAGSELEELALELLGQPKIFVLDADGKPVAANA